MPIIVPFYQPLLLTRGLLHKTFARAKLSYFNQSFFSPKVNGNNHANLSFSVVKVLCNGL